MSIYNTEQENEKVIRLDIPRSANIIKFPTGDLFFYFFGSSFILDKGYRVTKIPAPGNFCYIIIFFNKSIYYFGEKCDTNNINWRFDLDENRWSSFSAVPSNRYKICSSVVFNDNIIISNSKYQYLLLYSIDIDSWSKITFDFEMDNLKTLVKAEERLYIINHSIYESQIGNPYCWNQIAFKVLEYSDKFYCSYNRGLIYILYRWNHKRSYFKFDLSSKILTIIAYYRKYLALKQLNDKVELIEPSGTSQLNPELVDFCYDKGENLYYLADALDDIEKISINIKNNNNDVLAYRDKENALHEIGKNLEALECFNEGTKLDPNLPHLDWVDILYDSGRYQEAINFIDKQIKIDDEKFLLCLKKGIIYHDLGKYRMLYIIWAKILKHLNDRTK